MNRERATDPNADDTGTDATEIDDDGATYVEVNRWSDDRSADRADDSPLDVLFRSDSYDGIEAVPSPDGGTLATIRVGDHRIQLSEDVVRAASEELNDAGASNGHGGPKSESNAEERGDEIRRLSRACERLLDGGESVVTAQRIADEAGYEEAAKVEWRLAYSDLVSDRVELTEESGSGGYRLSEK